MVPTELKGKFPDNLKNKSLLMLITKLPSAGMTCKYANEDVDILVKTTALTWLQHTRPCLLYIA